MDWFLKLYSDSESDSLYCLSLEASESLPLEPELSSSDESLEEPIISSSIFRFYYSLSRLTDSLPEEPLSPDSELLSDF